MIDFHNAAYLKLHRAKNPGFLPAVEGLLRQDEHIVHCFQSVRDGVVFTNLRVIAINVQGVTGKKSDYTSLPYSKAQAFSIETAGILDLDSEIELTFSGLGTVRFEFLAGTNVIELGRIISEAML
ncbi:MAG: PH domain-containing protein [Oscillospiraceae bacterium]|nr:PH domain-containing protein [Oscillospiraceae bacterium]